MDVLGYPSRKVLTTTYKLRAGWVNTLQGDTKVESQVGLHVVMRLVTTGAIVLSDKFTIGAPAGAR